MRIKTTQPYCHPIRSTPLSLECSYMSFAHDRTSHTRSMTRNSLLHRHRKRPRRHPTGHRLSSHHPTSRTRLQHQGPTTSKNSLSPTRLE
jgi:hypothetical protein